MVHIECRGNGGKLRYDAIRRHWQLHGAAEITNLDMGFGIPDMSEDSFTFWVNMMDWFAEEMLAVANLTDDLPTTWGYIKQRS